MTLEDALYFHCVGDATKILFVFPGGLRGDVVLIPDFAGCSRQIQL